MIYEYDLTIPANTLVSAPVRQIMLIDRGIIHKVEVEFPGGSNKAVLVTIRDALHQVYPTNPDGQLKANNFTISGSEWLEVEEPPYQLEAYGWSPGTTYQHVITIRLYQLPREVLEPGRDAMNFLGRLRGLLFGGR